MNSRLGSSSSTARHLELRKEVGSVYVFSNKEKLRELTLIVNVAHTAVMF